MCLPQFLESRDGLRQSPFTDDTLTPLCRYLASLDLYAQALDAYAKAAKRFPRKLGIYLELAESVESVVLSPPQHIMVYQALASCLRRAMGKRFLGPDVRDLADAFAARLREYKLDGSKPKRLPPRRRGLPSRSVYEAATKATDLLVAKLMESRKRQEPQYEVAVQVVEGLVAWLDVCRRMAARIAATGGGEGEYADEEDEENGEEELDSDSDLRDSDEESAEEEASESDGADRSDDDGGYDDNDDSEDDEPMCRFVVERTTLVRYGICQLYCGEKGKASQAFAFLCNENADGEYGDRMLEIAKVRVTPLVPQSFLPTVQNCSRVVELHIVTVIDQVLVFLWALCRTACLLLLASGRQQGNQIQSSTLNFRVSTALPLCAPPGNRSSWTTCDRIY